MMMIVVVMRAQSKKPGPEVGLLVVIKIKMIGIFTIREADPSGQVFQRGYVLYGIYLPSLSGRLQVCHHFPHHRHPHHCQDPKLEDAYQKYAHRQRQKALILVNFSDLLLKVSSSASWTIIFITSSLPSSWLHNGYFPPLCISIIILIVKVIVLLKVVCVLPLTSIKELNQDDCIYTPATSRCGHICKLGQ